MRIRKLDRDYDPTNREAAYTHIREKSTHGEIATGLLYISTESKDMMEQVEAIPEPVHNRPYEDLCPGSAELEKLQAKFR